MTMTADEGTREAMKRLLQVMQEFKQLNPRMEVGQMIVLLTILVEPGMWARDLTARAGLKKAATSRSVKALTSLSYILDEDGAPRAGLDLITQIPDAIDQRAYQLAPTRKGWTLAEKLAAILNKKG